MPSRLAAVAYKIPLFIASIVFVPTTFFGGSRLILGSCEVRPTSESSDTPIPGIITVPVYTPFSFITEIVVAVPMSIITSGSLYSFIPPTASATRSLPSCAGLSVKIFNPVFKPEPQAVWAVKSENEKWNRTDAWYHRSNTGGGKWQYFKKLPERWTVNYGKLTFNIKPMGFKHTGLFPEQAVNWDWFSELIRNAKRPIRVLNLFAYTGGATVAALSAGAEVVHVDASKGMVTWAKENVISSGLGERPVRYIVDDVVKFVKREQRRGRQYDAIIMDPPSYGRGPSGEVWKIEDELYPLVEECMKKSI